MCGIVGVIESSAAADRGYRIRRATDSIRRRGPDDEGIWLEGNAGFGHRRLSVLDLSAAGHQPMISADQRYVVVHNGEIYNYNELRDKLGGRDANWRGRSDTEVILAAYAKWGVECVKYFSGMFAFAIWDKKEERLFAARDRMGVKPFYYHHSQDCFAFASRPRALFHLVPNMSNAFDQQGLRLYLECGYVPAPYSIFRDIRKLLPGHYLIIDSCGLTVRRYWDFRGIPPDPLWSRRSEEDLLDELDQLISRSVRSRLVSDVALGAFLSGGIDSSLVVAAMCKHSNGPIKTFTIGFREPAHDESTHAAAVAAHLGTEHYSEHLGVSDLLDLLPMFREEYDEPFFDSSALATMAVSRLARRHVTVSLSGDGGDELFGGYHYYQIARRLASVYRLPGVVRNIVATIINTVPRHQFKLLAGAMRQSSDTTAFAFARSIAKDFAGVLAPEFTNRTKGLGEIFSDAICNFPATLHPAERAMRLDGLYTLPDDYLQKVDVASMAFSLESREPLLDHELVEWSMKLPLRWKLRGGVNKYLLRKLAYRYLPRAVLDRPKQGFAPPIAEWLRGPLKEWASERLHNAPLFADLPLDQHKVLALYELHLAGRRNTHPLLWAILMLLDFAAQPSSPRSAFSSARKELSA